MSRKVRPFGIRGLMFSCRKLAEKYGVKWKLNGPNVRLYIPEVGMFCPITAANYHRTGNYSDPILAGFVGQSLGMEDYFVSDVIDAADGRKTSPECAKIRRTLESLTK